MMSERIIDLLLRYSLLVLFGLAVFYLALRRFKKVRTITPDIKTVKRRAAMYLSSWAEAVKRNDTDAVFLFGRKLNDYLEGDGSVIHIKGSGDQDANSLLDKTGLSTDLCSSTDEKEEIDQYLKNEPIHLSLPLKYVFMMLSGAYKNSPEEFRSKYTETLDYVFNHLGKGV